jgi:hypothetical protein
VRGGARRAGWARRGDAPARRTAPAASTRLSRRTRKPRRGAREGLQTCSCLARPPLARHPAHPRMFRCTVRDPHRDPADSKAVFYAVETVTDLAVYGGVGSRFAAQRRYSDFEAFHAALAAAGAGRRLPPLPAKNVFAVFGGAQARSSARSERPSAPLAPL